MRLQKRAEALLRVADSPVEFITRFNPDFCSERYEKIESQEAALKLKLVEMRDLPCIYTKDTPQDMLRAWLINLSIYCGLDTDGSVIRDIARELVREVWRFNLAELTLFFSKLKRGYYGKFYGRLDGLTIISGAREFRKERGFLISRMSDEEQEYYK